MASISKITLNSNTYEFKEAKDPVVIKTFESPQFPKEYMYGMHSFEINEVGPSGYKAVGIVHCETSGVVFPFNIIYREESGGKHHSLIGRSIRLEWSIPVMKHFLLKL